VLVDLDLAPMNLEIRWWSSAAFALFAAACVLLGRRVIIATAFNRMMLIALVAVTGWLAVSRIADALQPIDVAASMVRDLLAFAVILFFVALEVDRRLLLVPLIYAAGALVSILLPAQILYVTGAAHTLALGRIYQVWGATPEGRRPVMTDDS